MPDTPRDFWKLPPGGLAWPAWVLIFAKVALHLSLAHRYGIMRDELYFLACGEHLDFGYVDQPPLIAWVTALTRAVFGESLLGLRFPAALAGGCLLWFTARITRTLGGKAIAQGLACLCVLVAPVYLAMGHMLTMNVFEQLFWAIGAYQLLRLVRDDDLARWPALGFLLGLGFLNKVTFFFLGLCTLMGLLLTPKRRLLWCREFLAALGLAFVVACPYLYFQVREGWPSADFFRAYAAHKTYLVTPGEFLLQQVLTLQPNSLLVWLPGLLWLLFAPRGRPFRCFAYAYLLAGGSFLLQHAKFYFLTPMMPPLIAAGAALWERFLFRFGRAGYVAAAALALMFLVGGAISSVEALPILDPGPYLRYAPTSVFRDLVRTERRPPGTLPLHFSEMYGWEELAREVAQVYGALPAEEKAQAALLGANYGQAGAVDFYRDRFALPPAISGHNSYYLWGPGDRSLSTLLAVGIPQETLARYYGEVEVAGRVRCEYCPGSEGELTILVARRPRVSLREAWPDFRHFD